MHSLPGFVIILIIKKQLKMMKLDNFEKNILQSVEKGEWQSKSNLDNRLQELKGYIKQNKLVAELMAINPKSQIQNPKFNQ